jgi:predicted ribosomally synthesized peptide with SipW-like signal peptide
MTKRRAPRTGRRLDSVWLRAVLTLGVVLGLSSTATLAAWTDNGAVTTGTIQTGTVDLLLNDQLAGQGGTVTGTGLSSTDALLPGSTTAGTITVKNGGTRAFTFVTEGSATGVLAPVVTWTVRTGATVSAKTCTGGTVVGTSAPLSGTVRTMTPSTALAPGASQTYCLQTTLNPTAASSYQGTSATATINVKATQS